MPKGCASSLVRTEMAASLDFIISHVLSLMAATIKIIQARKLITIEITHLL